MESKFEDFPEYYNYFVIVDYPDETVGVCRIRRHESNLIRYDKYEKEWTVSVIEYTEKSWEMAV